MHYTSLLFLLALFLVSCETKPELQTEQSLQEESVKPSAREERIDFGKFFPHAGTEGSFTLYDLQKDAYQIWNPERSAKRFRPASTFKIFNSLVAIETGVINDENEMITWDGVKRQIPLWNRDHTLRSAIKHSVVWFYQELARRIGEEKMQSYIDSADYGNTDISGGIDRFWLDGGIRISPEEQIEFLVKLHNNQLPFSQRTMDIVKDIMILEKTDEYVYRGKTGWALRDSNSVGWFVGYLQRGDSTWFFATNIKMQNKEDAKHRTEITWNILESLELVRKTDEVDPR